MTKQAFSYESVYVMVSRIPKGCVATYGQIALLLGMPGYARQIGYALAALHGKNHNVPWHRVINSKGEISERSAIECENIQRLLLEKEGILFDAKGRISLSKFQWKLSNKRQKK